VGGKAVHDQGQATARATTIEAVHVARQHPDDLVVASKFVDASLSVHSYDV